MNKLTLAVRPKVIVNPDTTPIPMLAQWGIALHWLGTRYLCYKSINKRTDNAKI